MQIGARSLQHNFTGIACAFNAQLKTNSLWYGWMHTLTYEIEHTWAKLDTNRTNEKEIHNESNAFDRRENIDVWNELNDWVCVCVCEKRAQSKSEQFYRVAKCKHDQLICWAWCAIWVTKFAMPAGIRLESMCAPLVFCSALVAGLCCSACAFLTGWQYLAVLNRPKRAWQYNFYRLLIDAGRR